jgi:cytochrome c2
MVIIVLILAALLSSCAGKGEELFTTKGCIRCHSFKGKGGNIGPDLTAVADRRSGRWINDLSEYEIRSIIAYLKSR